MVDIGDHRLDLRRACPSSTGRYRCGGRRGSWCSRRLPSPRCRATTGHNSFGRATRTNPPGRAGSSPAIPESKNSLELHHGRHVAVLGNHRQQLAAFLGGSDHGITFLQGGRHRLLQQNVDPGIQRRNGCVSMRKGRRNHNRQINLVSANSFL